jgi:Secretion system C-terminal sorting domain
MKFKYFSTFLTHVLVLLFISTSYISAQDTILVEWTDQNGALVVDALFNAVMGDTATDGTRANLNRVYKLKKGGYYWNHSTITNDFPLRIIGETPGNDITTAPAVIQMVLGEGGVSPGKLIQGAESITMKNLYIIGSDDIGVQTYYQPIEMNVDNKRYIFDNIVFERSNFSLLSWNGKNNDIFITNCNFRNQIEAPPTQQWAGRGVSIWTDQDTVVFENNTFFNVNAFAIQVENGAANYLRFNHNTLINIGRQISAGGGWWREAYFANLLLVNVFWHGEGASDYDLSFAPNRATYSSGMFGVGTLPSRYGTDIGRRIVFSNASAYLDDYLVTQYADTVRTQPFINEVTDSFFTTFNPTSELKGQMVIQDTSWLSEYPNFTNNPVDQAFVEAMHTHITASRGYQYYGTGVQAKPLFYGLQVDNGDTLWTSATWPLPENFTYSDAALMTAGTDGLPLGDLNWFPSEKETFEANKNSFVTDIENLGGDKIVDKVIDELQAEAGALADGATVSPFTGDSWYTIVGGSDVEWTFNSTYAGAYDIKIEARADGQNIGFEFLVNGNRVVDAHHGWDQFVVWTDGDNGGVDFWSNKSTDEFYETAYTNDMLLDKDAAGATSVVSGENTLKLKASWNNISFKWVEFYEAGTTNLIARLIPPTAVNSGATPGGVGTWIPQGFNSIALGAGGSTTFDINLAEAGDYLVRIFYQNFGSVQTGSVLVDGSEVTSFTFDSESDSTGLDGTSSLFSLSDGAHTIGLSGSDVNVDWFQVLQRTVITGVEGENIPEGYALEQNYPNPFNPSTTINFKIAKASDVKLTVYNILGQRVSTLVNTYLTAGSHTLQFNANNLSTGIYFYSIEAGDFISHKKMILLK